MSRPDLSIVIVNYNSSGWLYNCLRSIRQNTAGVRYELIVVDNASTRGSLDAVLEDFPELKLIRNADNLGFARANNQGIEAGTGKYVLLLNPDTVVKGNVIGEVLSFAERHPQAGAVGCRILREDGSTDTSCSTDPSLTNFLISVFYLDKLLGWHPFFGQRRLSFWDYSSEREVDAISGCFMLIPRRVLLEQVGLLDGNFFMYMEELDWCRRARSAGWKIMFAPVGEIVHFGAGSSRGDESLVWVRHSQSMLKYFRKHYGEAKARGFRALLVPWLGARLLVCTLRRLVSLDRNEVALTKWTMNREALRWCLSGKE
jgi:GT2 family glycosyltransferase